MIKQIKKIGFWLLVLFLLILICLPGIWIFVSAFRPNPEILSKPANWIPDRWTIHQFTQMFSINGYVSVPAFKYLMNSVIISSVSTVIAITIGMMGGYAFARFNFKGKNKIFLSLMLARAVPGISLSLPLFILFAKQFAIFRAIGATKNYIFYVIWINSFVLVLIGCILGLIFGYLFTFITSMYIVNETGIYFKSSIGYSELYFIIYTLIIGLAISTIPAINLYRYPVIKFLR